MTALWGMKVERSLGQGDSLVGAGSNEMLSADGADGMLDQLVSAALSVLRGLPLSLLWGFDTRPHLCQVQGCAPMSRLPFSSICRRMVFSVRLLACTWRHGCLCSTPNPLKCLQHELGLGG